MTDQGRALENAMFKSIVNALREGEDTGRLAAVKRLAEPPYGADMGLRPPTC